MATREPSGSVSDVTKQKGRSPVANPGPYGGGCGRQLDVVGICEAWYAIVSASAPEGEPGG